MKDTCEASGAIGSHFSFAGAFAFAGDFVFASVFASAGIAKLDDIIVATTSADKNN